MSDADAAPVIQALSNGMRALLLPWMLEHMVNFTVQLFSDFHQFAR